ncbi:hypothetical protein PP178_04190 [Zeaxanthinibacter sp. PT1]|uniref:hypothetical protein n=1 Tax=Zeaxanthinibacter TaxID=561554 RepID=UPI00234BF690|nr:hypothetical protein [Zeaxanthinibacter sp. PT1]MDC6350741.1 hypothetical protein [Zeaxanthinibacter sp. PT1]
MDETWTDHKGRTLPLHGMSDKWLNNIRKKFGAEIVPHVVAELKRRKDKRKNFNKRTS